MKPTEKPKGKEAHLSRYRASEALGIKYASERSRCQCDGEPNEEQVNTHKALNLLIGA